MRKDLSSSLQSILDGYQIGRPQPPKILRLFLAGAICAGVWNIHWPRFKEDTSPRIYDKSWLNQQIIPIVTCRNNAIWFDSRYPRQSVIVMFIYSVEFCCQLIVGLRLKKM